MNMRVLKSDVSPLKRRISDACESSPKRFPVWLHVYDLGPLARWTINCMFGVKEGCFGIFHCGIEVLGVEWSFQAMLDCDTDMTGVMCHYPKSHPSHVYRESYYLGGSPLNSDEICKALARLEKEWPARSYHFLTHNCTDFAQELALNLKVPETFPAWAHGLAKGLATSSSASAQTPSTPWWLFGMASCNSCSSSCCSSGRVAMPCSSSVTAGCDQLCMAPTVHTPSKAEPPASSDRKLPPASAGRTSTSSDKQSHTASTGRLSTSPGKQSRSASASRGRTRPSAGGA